MSSSFPSPSFLPSTFCLRLRRGSLAVTCATGLAVSVFMYACGPQRRNSKSISRIGAKSDREVCAIHVCNATLPLSYPSLFINSPARGWRAVAPNCLYIIFNRNSEEGEGGASLGSWNGGLVSGSLIIISLIKNVRVRHLSLAFSRGRKLASRIHFIVLRRTCNAMRYV